MNVFIHKMNIFLVFLLYSFIGFGEKNSEVSIVRYNLGKKASNAKKLKTLSLHGMNNDAWKRYSSSGYKHYKVIAPGFKYNMTDMQASIGLEQLKKIRQNWKKRKIIWDTYHDELSKTKLILTPKESRGNKLAYHLFPIILNKNIKLSRDQLLTELNKAGIGCGVHYESIASHPYYYKKFGWRHKNTPNSYKFGKSQISLPITPMINKNDLDYIINILKKCIN